MAKSKRAQALDRLPGGRTMPPLGGGKKPDFTTERLRVWRLELAPSDVNIARQVFVACRNDIDWPAVAATAVVALDSPFAMGLSWMDWLEVTSKFRRKGIGRELVRGIEKFLGRRVEMSPVTMEGERFCRAMEREARVEMRVAGIEVVKPGNGAERRAGGRR